MWSNEVGKNRKTDEEHDDDDSIEEGFQLVKEKFDRDGEGGREAVRMACCSINI